VTCVTPGSRWFRDIRVTREEKRREEERRLRKKIKGK